MYIKVCLPICWLMGRCPLLTVVSLNIFFKVSYGHSWLKNSRIWLQDAGVTKLYDSS